MNKRFQRERNNAASARLNNSGRFKAMALLMTVALVLAGCSANSAVDSKQNTEASASSETTARSSDGQTGSAANQTQKASGQPGAETQKGGFSRPDLMGEVKSIVGNSLTLALAKVPTRESGASGQGSNPPTGGEMPSGGGMPPEGGGTPPEGFPGASGGQSAAGGASAKSNGGASSTQDRPSGGGATSGSTGQGSGAQGGGGQGTGGQAGFGGSGSAGTRRAMNLTLTGETKELLIPVGITITSGNGDNAKTIDIADIEKGDVLMIYFVEGTEDIEKITVR